MIQNIISFIKKQYIKKGYKTNEHIIVFESDDWGAIRSNKKGIAYLNKQNPDFDLNYYQKFDHLESENDVKELSEVLLRHIDKNGNHPVFTANFIMQNIVFEDFSNFKFEDFTDTYKKYGYKTIEEIKKAQKKGIICPELHGLIHFNLQKHLDSAKQDKIKYELLKLGMLGLEGGTYSGCDVFNIKKNENSYALNLKYAVEIFENIFKKKPQSFVFPCYVWNAAHEKILCDLGITNIQSNLIQNKPKLDSKKINNYSKILRKMGSKNKINGIYTIRNCFYEPIKYFEEPNGVENCKNNCLEQIRYAFKNKKPAIICSHRANYVAELNKHGCENNLKGLDELLSEIIKQYPDVKFLTSAELCKKISEER